ncbi:hypothetical protein L0U85_14360 [Glycomyces sp. L485]|uniref:TrmB family transcriptional regulator n=1 Tax=Glycomyces sp. L485 TaxID=2909235 RepID=UPI001F4BAD0F|nr:hypothetical protein [Glycomyces sp. L485]MCH7232029.1 hypothetical protein [Glycomyces sp. L485]
MTDDARDESDEPATGLGGDSERLYRLLLSKADSSVSQLAADAGLDGAEVRSMLAELVDAGFATMIADSRYRAVAPDIVLGGRLAMQLNTVRTGYEALRELLEIHRTGPGRGGRDDRGRWEQITGAVAIRSRLTRLRETAESAIRTFVRPPIILPVPDREQHRELHGRAVRHLLLFDRSVLDASPEASCLRHSIDSGDEIRFAKRLPLKMMVVDEHAAVIEEPGAGRPRAIITSNRSIVQLALSLFEQLWNTAIPAPVQEQNGGSEIDEDGALLLSLLIAGLTDQSIATKLGIGLRTVQRRVRDLMDLAEVDTRIQLGWHAAKNGWVS